MITLACSALQRRLFPVILKGAKQTKKLSQNVITSAFLARGANHDSSLAYPPHDHVPCRYPTGKMIVSGAAWDMITGDAALRKDSGR